MQETLKQILIAEDEKPMAAVLINKLEKEGFAVTAVDDGKSVLDILQTKQFDLILLDLMMPEMDGFGVLAELKNRGITTPVIVMSNLSQKEDYDKAKSFGAQDYLVKAEVTPKDIVEKINKHLTI